MSFVRRRPDGRWLGGGAGMLAAAFVAACYMQSAGAASADARRWPTHEVGLHVAVSSATEVVRATAVGEAEITRRRTEFIDAISDAGPGTGIDAGGDITYAECRQTFEVTEVICGDTWLGERDIAYEYVEEATTVIIHPWVEQAIPAGAEVILLLDERGRIVKALPDTEANRDAVAGFVDAVLENARAPKAFAAFLDGLDALTIYVRYVGRGDANEYETLVLKVPPITGAIVAVPVLWDQAPKIAAWLGTSGFFRRATRIAQDELAVAPAPSYELRVSAGPELRLAENLGWDLGMLQRLRSLRLVLEGQAAERMDGLLARLEEHRPEWEKAQAEAEALASEVEDEIQRYFRQPVPRKGYASWVKRGERLRPILPKLLASRDTKVIHEALLIARDRVGAPEIVPAVIAVLDNLLADPKDAEWVTRGLACEVLGKYRDPRAIPVLLRALQDPYLDYVLPLAPDVPGMEWFAVWRDADSALRSITGANPTEEPCWNEPVEAESDTLRKAWQAWWDANREGYRH